MAHPERFNIPPNTQSLLIIDDCLHSLTKSEVFASICRGKSHHENINVFLIIQDLSNTGTLLRQALRNVHYFIVTQNHADILQYMGRKQFMYMNQYVQQCFDIAKERLSYPYILINNTPTCPKDRSITSGILEGEEAILLALSV